MSEQCAHLVVADEIDGVEERRRGGGTDVHGEFGLELNVVHRVEQPNAVRRRAAQARHVRFAQTQHVIRRVAREYVCQVMETMRLQPILFCFQFSHELHNKKRDQFLYRM